MVAHFCMGNHLSKTLFSNSFPKNAEVTNLKNLDLDLIRSTLIECGYFPTVYFAVTISNVLLLS